MSEQILPISNVSFEFFPPKSEEGRAKLAAVREKLGRLKPEYYSVTFGAGGTTQEGTYDAVMEIKRAGFDAAPHLSCIGSTREGIARLLQRYIDGGIRRIVALRGDMPSGMRDAGEFRYANELVGFIRETTGDHFHVEVAAYPEFHPQARSASQDLDHFQRKVESGADSAITQYFYNPDAYFRFLDECGKRGINIPVVPGIMPITNFVQLNRFSEMCGAEIPRWIRKRLEQFGEDRDALRAFGQSVVTDLCHRLLDGGAPGLHFYTMNQAGPTLRVCEQLGLTPVEHQVSRQATPR